MVNPIEQFCAMQGEGTPHAMWLISANFGIRACRRKSARVWMVEKGGSIPFLTVPLKSQISSERESASRHNKKLKNRKQSLLGGT
jgi:hypothetical protein